MTTKLFQSKNSSNKIIVKKELKDTSLKSSFVITQNLSSLFSESEINSYNTNNKIINNNFEARLSLEELSESILEENDENLQPYFYLHPTVYDAYIDNLKVFVPSSLSTLLTKSLKRNNNLEINILSHEIIHLSSKDDTFDSNITFLYQDDIENETFLKLKLGMINKVESICDRFFKFVDPSIHNDLASSSYDNCLSIYDNLDNLTTFSNKLEKEINYGNIAENFITSGYSKINGKISNLTLGVHESSLFFTGSDDERLLDEQTTNETSLLSVDDLKIFYEKISGFKISRKNIEFDESFLNYEILNSDRLVGQLMLNCGVSMYSLYPNVDNISNNDLETKRIKVNSNAMQRYPIIQVYNLSPNSDMFRENNYDILGINGSSFNSNILKSSLSGQKISLFDDDLEDKRLIIKNQTPVNVNYSQKRSFYGTKFKRQNNFNNNIFSFTIKSGNSIRLYENIFFDVKSSFDHFTPTFIQLPTRWITNYGSSDGRNLEISGNDLGFFHTFSQYNYERNKQEISNVFKEKINKDSEDNSTDRARNSMINVIFDKMFANTLANRYLDNIKKFTNIYPLTGQNGFLRSYDKHYNITREIDNSLSSIFEDTFSDERGLSLEENMMDRMQTSSQQESWLNEYNESIADIDTNNLNSDNFINDSFVFSTSNSFLSKKELNKFSYEREIFSDNRESSKYIKTFSEKLLNGRNSSDNLKNITTINSSDTNNYIIKIASSCNIARRNLASSESIDKFNDFVKKANSKISQGEEFAFLYDDIEETSLDTFENSKFISKGLVYKNNFSKSFDNNVKNTSKVFSDSFNESLEDQDHIFSSKDYREFLSKYYTKSFFRNKKSLLLRMIRDNIDIFSTNNSFYTNREYFAFDILLATSLSNESNLDKNSNIENVKLILKNAIMNMSGVDQQVSFLKSQPVDNITFFNKNVIDKNNIASNSKEYELSKFLKKEFKKESIDKVVSSIFNKDTIKNQENFIIRTTAKKDLTVEDFSMTKLIVNNSVEAPDSVGEFKNIPGYLCTLKFPFIVKKHDFFKDDVLGKIKSAMYMSEVNTGMSENSYFSFYSEYLKILTKAAYNHDIFFDEENTGIIFYKSEGDEKIIGGYNFNDDLVQKGIIANLSYFDFDFTENSDSFVQLASFFLSTLWRSFGENEGLNEQLGFNVDINTTTWRSIVLENNEKILSAYTSNNFKIPYSYFYLANIPGTFSNKITSFAEDMLKVFKVDFSKMNNIGEIDSFVDNNSFYTRLLQDSLEAFSSMFVESYNIFNNLLVDEIKINLEDKDEAKSKAFFNNIENFYSFDNTSIRNKIVDDLKKIYNDNIASQVNFKYQDKELEINLMLDLNESNLEVYTGRYVKLKEVMRVLNNSDISESICHDLIHGYFLNFENNLINAGENTLELDQSIEFINNELDNISIDVFDNFNNLIGNEFYQNKISKDLQEIIYYKNIYNETFIRNNTFNTIAEKYDEGNVFNHRKLLASNMFKKASDGCGVISRDISSYDIFDVSTSGITLRRKVESNKKIDIIRLPIDYELLSKIGERGILEISILPINVKYPEIEYDELKYYYTPFLTDVTSNFFSDSGISTGSYLGFYNDAQKISNRYSVVDKKTALNEVKNVLNDSLSRSAEISGSLRAEKVEKVARKLVDDSIMSSAIKSINYVSQKHLDENVKLSSEDTENLISGQTISMASSLTEDDLVKIFDTYSINEFEFISDDRNYFNLDSNKNILENNDFYKKFLIEVDKDIASTEMIKCLLPSVFYDIHNIKINRDEFKINDSEEVIEYRYGSNVLEDENVDKCFTYYVGVRIL